MGGFDAWAGDVPSFDKGLWPSKRSGALEMPYKVLPPKKEQRMWG